MVSYQSIPSTWLDSILISFEFPSFPNSWSHGNSKAIHNLCTFRYTYITNPTNPSFLLVRPVDDDDDDDHVDWLAHQ